MRKNTNTVARIRAISVSMLVAFCGVASAGSPPADPVDFLDQLKAQSAPLPIDPSLDRVTTRGGWINFAWNDDTLRDIGLVRNNARGEIEKGGARVRFPLAAGSSFEFDLHNKGIPRFSTGVFGFAGGFSLTGKSGAIDWQNVRAVMRVQQPLRIDFVSADGDVLFYGDRVMYSLAGDGKALYIESMDLRVAPRLAEKLGRPYAVDQAVADVQIYSGIDTRLAASTPKACGDPNWPNRDVAGVPGAKYQADVFMISYSMSHSRCRATPAGGSCDGPNTATDGYIVYTPSSTLSNNRNNGTAVPVVNGDPLGTSTALYTADIRWLRKFTGTVAPYNNDQHPYLVWNLFRFESDGRITQVGRSGVKHAFVSTNTDPSGFPGTCQDCNGGNVLGIFCTDTYGTGNNDSQSDLGPRSELIPAKGIWGRCQSIYDLDCNGSANSPSYSTFENRMLVRESSIDPAQNPGDTWMSESWYIVREDVNIYNTMATRPFSASWNSTQWSPTNGSPFRLGPAIDRWFDAAPVGQQKLMTEIADKNGHTKVAVRVLDLGNGMYRYDYVVMNLDFAREETTGAEPNLRVVSNRGFDSFSLALGDVAVSALEFADADIDAANDWVGTVSGTPSVATWAVPSANTNTLDWATLYRFSLVSAEPPVNGTATLHIATAGDPAAYTAATLVPEPSGVTPPPDEMFMDGFETP